MIVVPTTWQVTGDTPDQLEFDGAGNPVQGHRVSFRTGDGNVGSVFVDDNHYNAANVRKMINAQAVRADEVAGLTGQV